MEATCRDCIASDLNKDTVTRDPYFMRIWKAMELKRAGVDVLELASSVDDILAIATVEREAERIAYEKAKEEAEVNRKGTEPD